MESAPLAIRKTQIMMLMLANRLAGSKAALGDKTSVEIMSGAQMEQAANLDLKELTNGLRNGDFTDKQFEQVLEIFHPDVFEKAKQQAAGKGGL